MLDRSSSVPTFQRGHVHLIVRGNNDTEQAMPWLRRLITGHSPRRPGFDNRTVHVTFVVDEVPRWQNFLPVLQFSPVSIIPPLLHTHSFIYHPRCIMFFSQHFSFPCQYHSSIAPHSAVQVWLTLHDPSNWQNHEWYRLQELVHAQT